MINPEYHIGKLHFAVSDIIGLIGVTMLLWAYLWLQLGRMSQYSLSYSAINLLSALFIIYSLFFNWNLSSFSIECAWILISLYGIYKALRHQ